ncbi:hypothetical protein BXY82_2919 [Gelidibacter sediminis]|uniref:Uncharacterized protein n=1 Tax=Gelidibacter sediminis TaxID=1608710 RepID=A0A4V3F6W8_9FLAO|nr:hypothetical protein [Gelidibacter sediminis]TDU34256.1 hypothetical protein BXY82_2919 [Gelidibacter sediminis]
MKSILTICIFVLLCNVKGFSQENLNAYKYVIVPNSYSFLNGADQYQVNSLTKFLFEKYGFTALFAEDDYPDDLTNNRCLGLFADVEKLSAFLKTKLQVHLKDCNNKIVYSSVVGESREKEYEKAYHFALRDAFNSFQTLNYNYQPNTTTTKLTDTTPSSPVSAEAQEEIERLQKEVEALKGSKLREEEALRKAEKQKQLKDVQPEVAQKVEKVIKADAKSNETVQTLFANPVENGYTITDASTKMLYHLVFSGKEDVYIVKGQDAIMYKMNTTWIIATANDSGVSMKTLNVKFN